MLVGVLLLTPTKAFSETVYYSLNDAFKAVFPNTTTITQNIDLSEDQKKTIESSLQMQIPNPPFTLYTFVNNDEKKGVGMVTEHIGKHEPITFFVGLYPDLSIKKVVVMVYREAYGSQVRKRRFLKQFKNKTIHDPIHVNHDITSISGATLSAYAIANGVKQVIQIVHTIGLDDQRVN